MSKKKLNKLIKVLEKNIKNENQFRAEELHKVALSSFIDNSGELDKRLISLSIGSLGFLLAFLINDYSYNSDFFKGITFIVFLCAVSGFSITIYLLLEILKLNNKYYQLIIAFPIVPESNSSKKANQLELLEKKMKKYDNCTKRVFILSIIASAFFIIMITINKNILEYNLDKEKKEMIMNEKELEEELQKQVQELINSGAKVDNESASGLFKSSYGQNKDKQSNDKNNDSEKGK